MSAQQLITDHLDIWTAAHKTRSIAGRGSSNKLDLYGIKKLRELILELAVRGKLVPQDFNDEPAIALINRIQIEKNALIKEKKIKKTSVSTGTLKDQIPYELPKGWEWIKLSETGNIFSGNSINSNIKEDLYTGIESGLPFIATKDVGYGWEEIDYENGVKIPIGEPKFLVARAQSVLICAEGGSAGKKCGVTRQDICFGNKLFANTLYGSIPSKYILANYLSPSFYQRFASEMTGIIGGISLASFIQLLIPLPPLAEQHRIVAKVDELMAFCDQLEQTQSDNIAAHAQLVEALLATLTNSSDHNELQNNWQRIVAHFDTLFTTEHSIDQLKQTILQLAVIGKLTYARTEDTNIKELLNSIVVNQKSRGLNSKDSQLLDTEYRTSLDNCFGNRALLKARFFCDFITKGTTPAKNDLLDVGEVPFLKVYNIVNNSLDFNYRPTFISTSTHSRALNRSKVFPGDVIMNIVGPPLGKVAIITNEYPEWNMNQALAVFRPLAGISSRYLYYMLSSKSILESVLIDVKGTAGQDNLSLEQCRDLLIPIPSCEEQHRIVTKVDELMTLCDTLKTNLQNAQTTQLSLADALVESAAGGRNTPASIEKFKEITMKIITPLELVPTAALKPDAVLAKIIKSEGAEIDAKKVWQKSKLDLPTFYKQLKIEIAAGYIVKPAAAEF